MAQATRKAARRNKGVATVTKATKTPKIPKMRINKRVLNRKRHTVGYMVDGEFRTVSQTAQLVRNDRINGVRIVGNHIQAIKGRRRLSDLPVVVRDSE